MPIMMCLTATEALPAACCLLPAAAPQVCEVCVHLKRGGEEHTVAAALTPDGSRAYKVNGKCVGGQGREGG